uniref:BTB domain-containing protein n=2 Tax=Panagrellus redivivus TaxID=6233 RepID=A0A7E4VUL0_PANRE
MTTQKPNTADHLIFYNHMHREGSDITILIGIAEIPAHKFFLSEASGYFKTLLSSNAMEVKSGKITLQEIDLYSFRIVLDYIYSGKVDYLFKETTRTSEIFSIIACGQYYMVDSLVNETYQHLENMHLCNSGNIELDLHFAKVIIPYGTDLIQEKVHDIIKKGVFKKLSSEMVEKLMKIHLNVREPVIFEALIAWMRANLDYSHLFAGFLGHIEFHLLDEKHFDMLFEPDRSFCQKLLTEQQKQAEKVRKVVNRNVINDLSDLRIVDGVMRRRTNLNIGSVATYMKDYIVIDLKQQYHLNCLKFELHNDLSYTVSVSKDMHDWECVIDYSKYKCFGQQVLYFDEHVARFIRIRSTEYTPFEINTHIEVLYSTNPLETDPATKLIIPKDNIIPPTALSKCDADSAGGYSEGCVIDGVVRHKIDSGCIIYHFWQPYIVDSMKLLLNKDISYYIEISTNGIDWTRVFAEENVSGWRIATFDKQPVSMIKVVGIQSSSEYLKLYKLECPAV